ncbi:MAG: hypothetical protein JSS28_00725 [Proteobacteria bacterium]|nr:hypothetical protein [Pseudomonadota bacterium]
MNTNEFPGWTERARSLLDESARDLDAPALARLNRARQAALAQRAPRRRAGWLFMPAGLAGACALLLAVGVWQARRPPSVATPAAAPAQAATAKAGSGLNAGDLDMIASGDNLDMVQDLDFYAWLDAQDEDHNG